MMFTKYIVVVDDVVDLQNTSEVLFHICVKHAQARGILNPLAARMTLP